MPVRMYRITPFFPQSSLLRVPTSVALHTCHTFFCKLVRKSCMYTGLLYFFASFERFPRASVHFSKLLPSWVFPSCNHYTAKSRSCGENEGRIRCAWYACILLRADRKDSGKRNLFEYSLAPGGRCSAFEIRIFRFLRSRKERVFAFECKESASTLTSR